MDRSITIYATLFGRILLGGYFLCSGIENALGFSVVVTFFTNHGYPDPSYVAMFVVGLKILFGIALIVDVKTRTSALVLAIYMLVWTFLFPQIATTTDTQVFLANMAIVGGLLMAAGMGTNKLKPSFRR